MGAGRRKRGWQFWTELKLDILARYLDRFTTAATRSPARIYLDAFAGVVENVRHDTGEPIDGSARIALNVDDPPFDQLHYFELAGKAAELQGLLRSEFPGRNVFVHGGDCNAEIPRVLGGLNKWAATFAFLDPDGMELRWDTLVALADHKRTTRYKVELWMLFTAAGIARTLPLEKALNRAAASRASQLFGTEQWRVIHDLRRRDEITGGEARDEYVNLMRWRLEEVLGYRHTYSLELLNARGVSMYHLVFATDNEAGNRIMSHLYGEAARRFPQMQQQAADRRRAERTGQERLFDVPATVERDDLFVQDPPWEPPGTAD